KVSCSRHHRAARLRRCGQRAAPTPHEEPQHMDKEFTVAVVGATGLVGEMMIRVLEERDFPVSRLFPLASDRSLGRSVSYRGRDYPVQELARFDFARCAFALF